MRFLSILLFSVLLFSFRPTVDVDDFEYRLDDLQNRLEENVMDRERCQRIHSDADELVDDIEETLEENEELTQRESEELQEVLEEAKRLEKFSRLIGHDQMSEVSFEEFSKMSGEFGFTFSKVSERYCLPIYRMEIGELLSYVANNSSEGLVITIFFRFNLRGKRSHGRATFNVGEMGFQSIWDNREDREVDKVEFRDFACTDTLDLPDYGY